MKFIVIPIFGTLKGIDEYEKSAISIATQPRIQVALQIIGSCTRLFIDWYSPS
jgi:hypothetical protein